MNAPSASLPPTAAPRMGGSRRRPAGPSLTPASLKDGLAFLYFLPLFTLVFTRGDMFLFKEGLWPLRPTLGFFALLGPPFALLFFRGIGGGWGRLLALPLRNAPLALPFIGLAALSLVTAVRPDAYWGESGKFILYPVYNAVVLLLAMALPLLPSFRRSFDKLVWAGFLTMVATLTADLFMPGFFAKHGSRAAGFAENPNGAAFLLALCCAVLTDPRRSRVYNLMVLSLGAFGLMLTLSRSGVLLFVLLLLSMSLVPLVDRRVRVRGQLAAVLLGVAGLVAAVGLMAILSSFEVGMFARHGAQDRAEQLARADLVDVSDSRVGLIRIYIEEISKAPVLGRGSGFAAGQAKGPHNLYLLVWVNLGLAGLACFLLWLAGGLWMFVRRRSIAGSVVMIQVAAASAFSHNLFENRGMLLVLGSLATLSLVEYRSLMEYRSPVEHRSSAEARSEATAGPSPRPGPASGAV